jgi:hypothetical protein
MATPPPPPGTCSVGPTPLRRLTREEYNSTVRDLLGLPMADVGRQLIADPSVDGFGNNAAAQQVTLPHLQQLVSVADALADEAARDLPKLVGCDVVTRGEATCATDFIRRFGKRAYRRPLHAQEEAILKGVFDVARSGGDWKAGITATVQAVLLAPQFLYRLEVAPGIMRPDRALPLSQHEIAARLSYLFLGSMPDAELVAAADAGRLGSKAEVRAQAERLLASPRAKLTVARFHADWLDLGGFAGVEKDPNLFPAFSASVAGAMAQETTQFLENVFWQDGSWPALLQAPLSFRNERLAKYYGEPGYTRPVGDDGSKLIRVETDPKTRGGVLTQGGLMVLQSKRDDTGPVERGKFVRERLLCGVIPPPPPGTNQVLPEPPPPFTTRTKLEHTEKNAACAACHRLMNPLGLAFETYDAGGKWRAVENNLPVDTKELQLHQTDVDGPFTGVPGLVDKLLGSAQAQTCMVKTWFRFAHGRTESDVDACTFADLRARFAGAKLSLRELLLALTQTDQFFHRTVAEGAVP